MSKPSDIILAKIQRMGGSKDDAITSIIEYLDETAKEKEVCEPKDTFKKEYIVIDKAPRWVTFNLSTGDFETEPYTHQDENFSNMCALQYCRCQS